MIPNYYNMGPHFIIIRSAYIDIVILFSTVREETHYNYFIRFDN